MKAGSGDQGSPPCFLRFPRPVRVVSGAEAELKCVVLGEPPPTVLWEKGGQQLAASERLSFPEDGAEHSLLLSSALPTDAGVYVCRARNAAGEAYAAAAITVLEPPSPEPEPQSSECPLPPPPGTGEGAPVFLTGPQSQWVLRGEEVVLTCQVGGLPEPKLSWEKDGMALDEVWDRNHFALEPGRDASGQGVSLTLRILAARLPDSGVYVCHARNVHGHAQAGALLQVHQSRESPPRDAEEPPIPVVEPLKCAPKTFWVNEGKHAKFRCYVMGKPEPEIEWHWEGRPLLPDRRRLMYRDRDGGFVLKVLYCQAKDRGLYVCAARNSAGQTLSAVQLHVKEPRLRFTRPLQDVEGREQGIVVLECKVPNSRIPTAWFREDQRLLPCRKYEQIEEGTVRRLIIHKLKADDDGVYLCEMRGRVRTVANVTVKGPILKRLPRKLDVLEGENAVLLVETQEAGVQGCWSRDGEELPATCQSSCGHMHALVLPGVTREDAGEVTFSLGNSRTTALLRVKCVKHSPPGPPVLVEMFKGQKNTVLLTWKPPEPFPESSFIYRLERQEVGSEDWVQCFSIEKAGAVEVPGDCVPSEGDYRFRICTVNEHGRSPHVVFNGSAHLVPTARLVSGLEDVKVYDGEDAVFSLDLSTIIQGTWFLNGEQLKSTEPEGQVEPGALRYRIEQKGVQHRLVLQAVKHQDSGALVGFSCPGVQDSAALTIQESPVHILSPQDKVSLTFTTSERVVLTCELSRADFPASWYKDGQKVEESESLIVKMDGCKHQLILPEAQVRDSGEFECRTEGVSAFFSVTVQDVSSWIVDPSGKVYVTAVRLERVVLTCELCRPWVEVHWTKDGEEVVESPALLLEKEDNIRRLVLPSVQLEDSGEYLCEINDESASFTVTVTEPPVRIIYPRDEVTLIAVSLECVVLTCELSRADAPVHWYKDGLEVEESEALVLESDGPRRRLVLPAAQPEDGGEFVCDAGDDSAFFTVTVTAPPERIVRPAARSLDLQFGAPGHVELRCEVSPAGSQVRWYKDGLEVEVSDALQLGAEGPARTLTLPHAQPEDAGEYVCETRDEAVTFNVSLAEPPVQFLAPEAAPNPLCVAPGEPVVLSCELSRASARVFWSHNGSPVQQGEGLELRAEGPRRILFIQAAELAHAGVYTCQSGAAPGAPSLNFNVRVAEPPPAKVVSELTPLTVHEGDDATFQCDVSPSDAEVTWLRNGAVITPGPRVEMVQNGSSRSLIIRGCQLQDAGTLTARAGAADTSARLHVRETELLFLRRLQDVRAEEGQEVCLEVETGRVGAAGAVRWLRGGEPLPLDSRLTTAQDGRVHRLSIQGVLLTDQGTYGCESHHDRTLARLSVRPRQLRELRPLEDVTVSEGGSTTFQLELSQEGVTGEWARGGVRLHPGPKCHIHSEGRTHRLVLSGLGLADSGCISFTADTLRCAARLSVREVPVTIVQGPQDLEVTEGDTATFECELSQTLADVTWEKDGQPLSLSPRLRLQALGTRRLLLLRSCSASDAGTYSCTVGTARAGPARLTVREREVCVLRELRSVSAREGDSATFECTVSETQTIGRWALGGRALKPGGRVRIRQEGKRHVLVLSELRAEDTGEVCFQAGPAQSLARLEVEALPLQMCRRPPREKTVLAGRRAVLEVTVSRPGGHVCWMREGVGLCPGTKYEMRSHGATHSLVIHDVRPEDQGTYSCQAGQDSADTQLLVEG
ncbi:obscurin-like protein 1 isoform X2 [Psammomys obesus]|uniref:obscurin-like protein 1 isoform X2 n=1 Tax=Psammomys obesus TaxID=48139 RepID=UPI002452DF1D|nr:obscurin-like protein 1 isoform X2 [Psammomys obesus]